MKIDFGMDGNYYSPEHGPNWWQYYFEPLSLGSEENAVVIPSTQAANMVAWTARRGLSRHEASRLIHNHVKIKKDILDLAQDFATRHFESYTIGVHFRGTDKHIEAPRVAYEEVLNAIINQIQTINADRYTIFVATDEQQFLEYIQGYFPDKVIATQATRSDNGFNVHSHSDQPYEIGFEALLDAILLSKCDVLIRTSSSLSLWSTYYNPEIPEIILNHRFYFSAE